MCDAAKFLAACAVLDAIPQDSFIERCEDGEWQAGMVLSSVGHLAYPQTKSEFMVDAFIKLGAIMSQVIG